MDLTLPFHGYNRPGATVSDAVRNNWWRQGMMGGVMAACGCIFQFAQVDFSDDRRALDISVLVPHGMPATHADAINAGLLAFSRRDR